MSVSFLICRCCGDVFRSDEGSRYSVMVGAGPWAEMRTYADPPYDWHARHGYCLTCWLICDASWHQPFRNTN